MKIVISILGSRGDVQPYLALAVGLQRAGHRVTLVAPYNFGEWIQAHGVHIAPVPLNPQTIIKAPEVQALLKSRNIVGLIRRMRKALGPEIVETFECFWRAAADADFVMETTTGRGGVDIAGARQIPVALSFLQPFMPTRAFPTYLLPLRFSLGGAYNRLTHTAMLTLLWPAVAQPINQWRARHNLPPWRSLVQALESRRQVGAPWLFAYSPSVVPKPADWPDDYHVTGYWFLDEALGWQPPAELERFLAAGPPPVYVGFGSMVDEDPERMTRLTLRALELSGQRGVLVSGWGGLARLASAAPVFHLPEAPHHWLFPRMAAVVHHGGAGTTGAGLRAGVPSILTPFAFDQYAWADQVVRLGVGPRAPAVGQLTAEKLAVAIQAAVSDTALRQRAAALGARIRAEAGVARAVEIIERHAAEFPRRVAPA